MWQWVKISKLEAHLTRGEVTVMLHPRKLTYDFYLKEDVETKDWFGGDGRALPLENQGEKKSS
jgi:hypothetical protein